MKKIYFCLFQLKCCVERNVCVFPPWNLLYDVSVFQFVLHYLAVLLGLGDSAAFQALLVPRKKKCSPISQVPETPFHISNGSPQFSHSLGKLVCHTPLWPVCGTFCAPAVCSWCICSLVFQDPRCGPHRWHSGLAAQGKQRWKMGKQAHIRWANTTTEALKYLFNMEKPYKELSILLACPTTSRRCSLVKAIYNSCLFGQSNLQGNK